MGRLEVLVVSSLAQGSSTRSEQQVTSWNASALTRGAEQHTTKRQRQVDLHVRSYLKKKKERKTNVMEGYWLPHPVGTHGRRFSVNIDMVWQAGLTFSLSILRLRGI